MCVFWGNSKLLKLKAQGGLGGPAADVPCVHGCVCVVEREGRIEPPG